MSSPTREAPGPLHYRSPDCPLCLAEVDWDDGFVCSTCGAYWSSTDESDPGEWSDDEAEACGATHTFQQHGPWSCVLDAGHGGQHAHPSWIPWDGDERERQP